MRLAPMLAHAQALEPLQLLALVEAAIATFAAPMVFVPLIAPQVDRKTNSQLAFKP